MTFPANFKTNWVNSVSPNEAFKFKRRIDWDNISEEDLYKYSKSPEYYFTSEFLLSAQNNTLYIQNTLSEYAELPLDNIQPNESRSFVDLWSPLKITVPNLLLDKYSNLYSICSATAVDHIVDLLINRLVDLSDALLWNQYLIFRKPGAFFTAQIQINNHQKPSRSVYRDFIFYLRRDSLSSLFRDYPVYEFYIGVIFTHWWSFIIEFLDRLIDDRSALLSTFSIPTTAILTEIQGGLSDPHRFSRTVLILSFSHSSDTLSSPLQRLVYKPKSLELEFNYYQFLTYLNTTSSLPQFRTLNILCMSNYGYVEFISRDTLTPEGDLPHFYYMLGRLSSVLWLLGCTDLHHENLIISSNQLILVDAETIFDSPIPSASSGEVNLLPTQLESLLFRSLLTCGLLPFWTHYGPLNTPVDISAIGIDSPSNLISSREGWLHINTDAMTAGTINVPSKLPSTLPYTIGAQNIFSQFVDSFVSGFESQSNYFITNSSDLLNSGGLIDSFLGITRRALIRSTQIYYTVQRKQFLPTSLSSFPNQFLVLEKLSRGFLTYSDKPNHWPIFHSEKHQMINLDIPMFEHNIGSPHFTTSLNQEAYLDFPDSHKSVQQRLCDLDSSSFSFQILLIRGSFDAATLHLPTLLSPSSFSTTSISPISPPVTNSSKNTDPAQIFIRYLINNVYHDSSFRCQWLGFNLHVSNVYSFYSLDCSLFSGIASFPSYIQLLRQSNHLDLNLSSYELSLLDKIEDSTTSTLSFWIDHPDSSPLFRWWRDGSHGLCGCGGHLLALSLSSSCDIDSFFIPEAFDFCVSTLRLSLLHGSLGLIPALISIGTSSSLDLASRLAQHMCKEIHKANLFNFKDRDLSIGFLYGCSGITPVFSRIYLTFRDSIYLDLARSALEYERSRFNSDLSIPPVINYTFFDRTTCTSIDQVFSLDLASGLSGILLSRLCLFSTPLWDDRCFEEVLYFLDFILRQEHLLSGLNLAHGRLGALAVVDLALNLPLNLPSSLKTRLYQFVLEQRITIINNLSLPNPQFYPNRVLSVHPLGFFNGLAGISFYFESIASGSSDFIYYLTGGLLRLPLKNVQ